MLINPGAQQRVAGFEAEEEEEEEKGSEKRSQRRKKNDFVVFCFVMAILLPYLCESLGGAREDGEWRGCWERDGGWFVLGVCVPVTVSLWGKLAGAAWPPSGGHGYGNQFKNRTQDGFHSLQLPREKKREGFLSISFHSFWLLAEMVFSVLAWNTQSTVSWWKVPLVASRAILPEPKEYAVHVKLFS